MYLRTLYNLRKTLKAKQVLALFTVNILSIPIGIASSIFITRYLGVKDFGDFSFLISIFSLSIIVFDFGLFQGGNRALVLNKNILKAKELYGAGLVCLLLLFVAMSLILCIYAQFDQNLISKGLKRFFIILLPFGWLFIVPRFYETLFQADNKIKELAISRILTAFGKLVVYLFAYFFFTGAQYDRLKLILYFYLISNLFVFIYILIIIKPSFLNVRTRLSEIWYYTKKFGFHVYTGSVFAVGMSQLVVVLISYFSLENSVVGHFSLAVAFSSPLKLIPNTIATTHYRDFGESSSIPRKLTSLTITISIAAMIFLWLIIYPFISIFYGEDFLPVINLTLIMSIGMFFYGVADYLNRFLGAHGEGRSLRNSAILVGLTLIISTFILIPMFGVIGAAIAQSISGVAYLWSMLIYYRTYTKGLKKG